MLENESIVNFYWRSARTYSKAFALLYCGTFPTVAILFKAGGCPADGGGVVLPS